MTIAEDIIQAAQTLSNRVESCSFSLPITHVYNPLNYAWKAHEAYIRNYGHCKKKVVFLGMNPGPYGMVQTAIPFGEIRAVRDWMRIQASIGKPKREHPKRPVEGFNCQRSEVSGQRLWGLFGNRFPNPSDFFAGHFVVNYCPLAFMEESGRNRTPDKLPMSEMAPVIEACDHHLKRVVDVLQPDWLIGVGQFASKRLQRLDTIPKVKIGTVLHPSPASPAANRGWAETATKQLQELEVW